MSEIAAGTLPQAREAERPGFGRMLLWAGLGGALGVVFGGGVLLVPAIAGIATMPVAEGGGPGWYPLETPGGVIANVAALAILLWGLTSTIRGVFRLGGGPVPASTWIALTFAPAMLIALTPLVTAAPAGLAAALALRYTAFAADGAPRPEPLGALSPLARHVVRVAVPVVGLGVVTAYAVYHPLDVWSGGGDPIRPGRTTISVHMTTFTNEGARALEVLAIEPGVERGYALHLSGVALNRMDTIMPGESRTRPFRPFTLKPHAEAPSLSLVLSRAGCRPGASGAIESVRVRYRLGGERSMLLRFHEPLRLRC